ncbi:MAG TPA: GNAT family N-acetyltransferase [Kribbella sp.]|jgi:GNAT superfamily N-acetyltransferase
MGEIELRTASDADLEGVVVSCAALFAEDGATRDRLRDSSWPAMHGPKWCGDLLADRAALVLVAVSDGEVVGHLVGSFAEPSEMWTGARAELVSLYVRPVLRGRGVGGRLVDTFVAWAKDRGAVRLHVTAYGTNEQALALYQKHGFVPLSVTLAADL